MLRKYLRKKKNYLCMLRNYLNDLRNYLTKIIFYLTEIIFYLSMFFTEMLQRTGKFATFAMHCNRNGVSCSAKDFY